MKKVILSSVLAAAAIGSASSANAQVSTAPTAYCAGVAGNGTTATTTAGGFVITVFTPKCSQNVYMAGSDNSTFYRVGAGSSKGKNRFAGSTMGGGIASAGSCAVTGCTAADATTALTTGATS